MLVILNKAKDPMLPLHPLLPLLFCLSFPEGICFSHSLLHFRPPRRRAHPIMLNLRSQIVISNQQTDWP